jgi:chaperone modulatory protein CbpM
MAATKSLVPMSEVVTTLSLNDLCHISGSSADWVIELIEEGILEPTGPSRTAWRFESSSITIIRKVQRLQADLRINIPGVALVLSLAEENAALKRRLMQVENEPPHPILMSGPED